MRKWKSILEIFVFEKPRVLVMTSTECNGNRNSIWLVGFIYSDLIKITKTRYETENKTLLIADQGNIDVW